MRRPSLCVLLHLFAALVIASGGALAQPSPNAHITLGHSTVPLNGPWRFHVGDDARWASPDFDDSAWEAVDLTPAPGAHDGDVGLPGYVTGWSQRGHAGYTGYAWYRMKVTVESGAGTPLALAGPTLVDSTYQLYVDGKLLGGSGVFTGASPTVYGVRPTKFSLPQTSSAGTQTFVVAIRVWMDPVDASSESGGMHVAPTMGDAEGIDRLVQVQWLQTFKGYVVDAIEPLAFVLLACMVFGLIASRTRDSYRWLVAALLLLALLRVHQVLFYWTPYLSLRCYDVTVTVLLRPLVLAAWALAWRDWFRLPASPWWGRAISVLTAAYIALALIGRPWFPPYDAHGLKAAADVAVQCIRLAFVALYLWTLGAGVLRSASASGCVAAITAILVGIGLFASELNAIGIPGIWFPYGTGVARGQYAYAAFIALFFVLILVRSAGYARRR